MNANLDWMKTFLLNDISYVIEINKLKIHLIINTIILLGTYFTLHF
jgi:hypothetical protein